MGHAQLDCIVNSVKLSCKNHPKLRKNDALLVRDIAVVCTGLRTAVMVDYMPLKAAAMLAILADAETHAATLQQSAWPKLALLELDNCLYLLRQDALQSRLAHMSTCSSSPAYVAVSNLHGSPCLALASEHDVQEVTHQLRHMSNLILAAVPESNDSSCTLVDLSSVVGIPIMPTLSGWLLQYPVVYLAHPDTAVIMAQLLSEAVLVLYDVQVAGRFTETPLQSVSMLRDEMQDLKQLSSSQGQLASLYAFTVPETLLSQSCCKLAISHWKMIMTKQALQASTDNILTEHTITSRRLAPRTVQI